MKIIERLYCSSLSTHKAIVLIVIAGFLGASLWGIWGLGVDADFMALLDPSDQTVKTYQAVQEDFTGTDAFLLFIDGVKNSEKSRLPQFLTQLQNLKQVSQGRAIPMNNGAGIIGRDGFGPVLVLVKPFFKPTDFKQSRQLSKTIRSVAEQFDLPVGITGSYQVLIESADAANQDMRRAGVVTLAGILILLLLVFRIPWRVVLCMGVTLCVGLCWTLGLVRLTMGQLNLLTATLPAVILGLGVDFSLHMIYAFSEKASVLSPDDSGSLLKPEASFLPYVFSRIYKPLLIGAFTTSAAFLSLCVAKSSGLFQMGLMGAMGIGCTFAAATGLLPILLSKVSVNALAKIPRIKSDRFKGVLFSGTKGWLFMIFVFALALGVVGSSRVRFSSDQNKLADRSLPAYVLQNKLQDEQGVSLVPIAFVCPDVQTEQAKLAFLFGLTDSPFGLLESGLLSQQQGGEPDRFIGKDQKRLILAYPKSNAFDPVVFDRIAAVADECRNQFSGPGNLITGSPFLNAALNRMIKVDLFHCSLLAGLVVFVLVFYCFRGLLHTVAAVLPVALGTILMVGLMGYLKIDFTIMTIVIVPLVIGAGIDDGVHLLSRWRIEKGNVLEALNSVGTPIIGTTLTSMIGFGSLLLSRNPGFRQLGLVVMRGLFFCMLVSLFFLPRVLNLLRGDRS